mmetsp:Transcript_338/g.425  ORF Transcript_338/g.425 Transcript_338/m.425 type:complete len:82 (+) Transcript_338:101-346(+)|eukprot:CAMPEP_0178953912 /NCGR_PEP_ID=MMETSP0789-20121207/8689_1 /TAXON_ID=3005 /ORGANISM="Rhizosolenia setigera, Strain CCMP 1694" /LENGTH=81 /DNA_ID=CAMNT_0020635237 /DNA_START=186 /DNA_END=431 /DNA_ORIENTATION=-
MPWQTAPSFAIIAVAMGAAGGLMHGVQKLFVGKDREVLRDNFTFNLENRDDSISEFRKTKFQGNVVDTELSLKKRMEALSS